MTYQKPTEVQAFDMAAVEDAVHAIDEVLSRYGSRRSAIARTQLEQAHMWANKAIVKGDAND